MFGSIVLSLAGRDKGNYFVVTDITDNFAYIVDGKIHKVENPKLKKLKHMAVQDYKVEDLTNKIKNKSKITNQEVKKALKKLGGSNV
jgi:ribosomal protein L14E/L6E/L27E